MVIIWIVLWFGGAGVFCAFEKWTFLESLYFCYVTLTTIGFGDYVPTEPEYIEFWNIYVFVGLTIFAYILSLFSESMAAHIHLVDDDEVDEDEDDHFGWEQCEGDPNAPHGPPPVLIFSRGVTLGLEGTKWPQNHQDQIRLHSLQTQQEMAEISLQPKLQSNQDNPRRNAHFWDGFGGRVSRTGDQSQEQLSLRRRKSSAGRILRVSAKGRKQMLQAEYYANQRGPSSNESNMIINSNETLDDGGRLESAQNQGDALAMAPAAIKSVDMYSVSHQRRVGNRLSSESATGSANSPSSAINPTQQAYVYGTSGYQGAMAKRRRSMLSVRTRDIQPSSPSSHSPDYSRYSASGSNYGSDIYHPEPSPASGLATPRSIRCQQEHSYPGESSQDLYVQSNALQHQPQVRFESPRALLRGYTMSRRNSTQQYSPQSRQNQRESINGVNNESVFILPSGNEGVSTSLDSLRNQRVSFNDEQEAVLPLQGPPLLLPRPRGDRDGSLATLHTPWSKEKENEDKTKAYERYLEQEHTRQSHSSDTTKVGSPMPQTLTTDPFSNTNAFPVQILNNNSTLDEVFDGSNTVFTSGNQRVILWNRDGIAPDEMPPGEYSNILITPPNSRPYQSELDSFPDTNKKPSPNRLWKSAMNSGASDLKPIWEQRSSNSSLPRFSSPASVTVPSLTAMADIVTIKSVGPFDETRDSDTIPTFEVEVDLNHATPDPRQVSEARKDATELKERQKVIEARMRVDSIGS
ncbi:hypothetical protein BGX26_011895 [Mortierella sp. AD094]|nr:hypothetical protein BGX26_011895 [Mortierella sp. AD094]